MSKTLAQLRSEVLVRMQDTAQQIWTADEVDGHLVNAYQFVANKCRVFWDVFYDETIPGHMSMNYAWERRFLVAGGAAIFDYGVANYTCVDELLASPDERNTIGPGSFTSPFELADGHFDHAGCDPSIPAVSQLPDTLTAIDRVTWDKRGIDSMDARRMSKVDARYEITAGEVYGYIWQKDGIRSLRKVRVPAQRAALYSLEGDFGIPRDFSDIWPRTDWTGWTDPGFDAGGFDPGGFYTQVTDGTLWGMPRRIPGHHPLGWQAPGAPRRFYQDTTNVRVEHFRQGAPFELPDDLCELVDLYAGYLKDYAQYKLFERRGPGQDVTLAAHYKTRWDRNVARIDRRLRLVDREHVMVMGGSGRPSTTRPPRPKLPWPYGSVVRW